MISMRLASDCLLEKPSCLVLSAIRRMQNFRSVKVARIVYAPSANRRLGYDALRGVKVARIIGPVKGPQSRGFPCPIHGAFPDRGPNTRTDLTDNESRTHVGDRWSYRRRQDHEDGNHQRLCIHL